MLTSSSPASETPQKTRSTNREPARAPVHCFSILAAAEPGVMPRVLELFAKRNLVPQRWHSDVGGRDGGELSIDIQVTGLDQPTADYVARCLRQLAYVETVLTSEKRYA